MTDIDVPEVDGITVGAVGEPGRRIFYLQVWAHGTIRSLKVEKQQVAALGAAVSELLADVAIDDPVALPDLIDPGEPEWVVGAMALTEVDERTGRVILVLTEFVPGLDDDEDGPSGAAPEPLDAPIPAQARLGLSLGQLAALGLRCEQAVQGGRTQCELCGRPKDPAGHVCPKTNGAAKH